MLTVAALFLLGLAGSGAVVAQGTPGYADAFNIDTVEKWDTRIDAMRRLAAQTQADPGVKDIRGRTVADDWKEWVLKPDLDAHLTELREKVRTQAVAADYDGMNQTMKEATPLVQAELYKSSFLAAYWLAQGGLVHHRKLMEPLLAGVPAAQAKPIRDHMAAVEQDLADSVPATMALNGEAEGTRRNMMMLTQTKLAAFESFNANRAQLVGLQKPARGGKTVNKTRVRQSPCPAEALDTSGSASPRLAPNNVSLDAVYPPLATRDEVEGNVTLEVSISPTGCMERAEVVASSGADELDEAAMLWAEYGSFLPGEVDQKPVAGKFRFKIKFEVSK